MKLILALIATSLQVTASTHAQQITLSYKNAALYDVMQDITEQSGYSFTLAPELLKKSKPVTITLKSATIDKTLQSLFTDQPFIYQIKGKVVMVSSKPTVQQAQPETSTANKEITLTGMVRDKNGSPLPGATVLVKGTNTGAVSGSDGRFSIFGAPETGVLIVRMIGRESREIFFKNGVVSNIILRETEADLSEVQIIAYGQVEKRYSTSSIGTVKAEEIQRQPVSNPLLTLTGRIPGLYVKQASGYTTAAPTLNVQGINSLRQGTEPFYVVDGVPYSSQFTNQSLSSLTIGGGGSPFSFINPSDIESISILKDADATAIYGSRAANGAILITTRKGKSGKTSVNFNLQSGWGKVTRRLDILNTQEYLTLRKEGYINDGLEVPTSSSVPDPSNYDLTVWDQHKYTDWQDVFIGKTARYNDLQGSISGGSLNTQFLASYGYHYETTVLPGDFYDRKGNVRFNLNHKSTDNRFKFQMNSAYVLGRNTLTSEEITGKILGLAPNAPDLYLPNGNLNWGYLPDGLTNTLNNPLIATIERFTGSTTNLIANNRLSYEVIPGLDLGISLGYNKLSADETRLRPISIYPPADPNKIRTGTYMNKSISTWIAEPQLTYNKATGFGNFDFLLGATMQQSKTDIMQQSGSGYLTDYALEDLGSATNKIIDFVNQNLYRYSAAFGRLNYRLNDKYIVNLALRRDGSSRFGRENKFHTFYAIGGAWLFAEEYLVKKALPWLSYGKLRGSYGTTGSDQIPDYRYLSLLDNHAAVQIPYQGGSSLFPNRIANPYIQWEETRKLNLGIDLGVFNNKILVNFSYARNRSSNQLVSNRIPSMTGFSGVDANFQALIENTSLEGQITFAAISKKNFKWDVSANITQPKNKLLKFPNLEQSAYATQYTIGKSINIIRGYEYAGVNSENGLYQFLAANGELTSTPNSQTDMTATIDVNPKFYGGLSNSFTYKGFQLDFLFQFVKQTGATVKLGNYPGFINSVPLRSVLSRWQNKGDITDIQKVGVSDEIMTAYGYATSSTANYGDASFIRLKNAAFSYSLPKNIISKAKMSNARIYVQAQNLLTITDYYGSDPEVQNAGVLPPLRVITLGLQATF